LGLLNKPKAKVCLWIPEASYHVSERRYAADIFEYSKELLVFLYSNTEGSFYLHPQAGIARFHVGCAPIILDSSGKYS